MSRYRVDFKDLRVKRTDKNWEIMKTQRHFSKARSKKWRLKDV